MDMIKVEKLTSYSADDAAGIGALRPYLVPNASRDPVDEQFLREIIESAGSEQLVARLAGSDQIIGTATLTIVRGALTKRKGWLEDFVSDPGSGLSGVGQAVWDAIGDWCRENNIDLEFTSNKTRLIARAFYAKNGATIRDTSVFTKKFK